MMRYASLAQAKQSVGHWSGTPDNVVHLGDFGNSVFSFQNSRNATQILRFTDSDFRTYDDVMAELKFVDHLHLSGVSVARPCVASDGALATRIGDYIASSVEIAPGLEVSEGSPYWSKALFYEWGRSLALIHRSAMTYRPNDDAPLRWQWNAELLLAKAEDLIPAEDQASREELSEVLAHCRGLEKSPDSFGLIHADHAPQNFRYARDSGVLTVFDFGNCCYHWFVADLAISLSTVRRKPNRDAIRANMVEGYLSVKSLPPNLDELIDLFIRLRVLYVYLSRLHLWAENLTASQKTELTALRQRVHTKTGWNL